MTMPSTAAAVATTIRMVLFSYPHVPAMSASPNSTTGSSQCSRRCVISSGIHVTSGSWMIPPTIDSVASTTSGKSMIHGLSCGLKSPCAPCSSARSSQRASPKKTITTWRVM